MSQTTTRPSSGVRYAVEHAEGAQGEDILYRGFAYLPAAALPLEVRVGASGAAVAQLDARTMPEGAGDVAEMQREAAALLKMAVKAAGVAGRPPPRRVVRWRA
ncbi:hypothetical protein [Chondromyces apiculatus]|uniref:hypothetical protein n=1 Tax=Chondromyces apiculatus TaxID=51 RepID=UPI0005C67C43|nr:hypothetical protein [Chondromyces apiculatus]